MRYCSIIIPIFNEENNILPVFDEIMLYFHSNGGSRYRLGEIILVDDGSSDLSRIELNKIKEQSSLVRVISKPHLGFGAAIAEGFRQARFGLIVYTDGDTQYRFAECFPRLISSIPKDQFFIVSGKRTVRADNILRLGLAILGRIFLRIFKLKMCDIDCGFKIYTKALLDQTNFTSQTFLIHTEIYLQALRRGAVIREVAIPHYPRRRERSSVLTFRTIFKASKESWGILGKELKFKYGLTSY